VRLFLAINLPAEVREAIDLATEPLRIAAPNVAWTSAAKMHLTLKFLGDQPETVVEPLRDAMARVATTHRVIELELRGVGAFPNLRRPRVVWLGIRPTPKLELLHHDVETSCDTLGFELEGRPFRPHLTLGRVGDRVAEAEWRGIAASARAIDYQETTMVESIDLMRSHLSPAGARYEMLASARLLEES
jgi:RNA 2',3'-cyclic 3'-phosphodiesterase